MNRRTFIRASAAATLPLVGVAVQGKEMNAAPTVVTKAYPIGFALQTDQVRQIPASYIFKGVASNNEVGQTWNGPGNFSGFLYFQGDPSEPTVARTFRCVPINVNHDLAGLVPLAQKGNYSIYEVI